MQTGGKLQFVLLSICHQIFTCSCSSIDFQNRNINSWEIRIGANDDEFLYDFCQYDASENMERCKNKASATINIKKKCNCTVNYTANAEDDSVYFTINCNNEKVHGFTGACPQKLTITYEHGDVSHPVTSAETPSVTHMEDKCSGCVNWIVPLSLSLVINVVFVVLLYMLRSEVSSLFTRFCQYRQAAQTGTD